VYGFRSEPRALEEIEAIRPLGKRVTRVELVDERYYHGDTCLCSFGPGREFLLAYPPALHPESLAKLRACLGPRLIEIGDADAAIYAANSFALQREGESLLVMPRGVSAELASAVKATGTRVVDVDVSEFHKKGGGSVKCMIGDLGEL
jgi:N-dimethylarginine dimethylaminohydrolase